MGRILREVCSKEFIPWGSIVSKSWMKKDSSSSRVGVWVRWGWGRDWKMGVTVKSHGLSWSFIWIDRAVSL